MSVRLDCRNRLLLVVGVALAGTALAGAAAAGNAPDRLQRQALHVASESRSVARAELSLVETTQETLSLTSQTFYDFKVMNRSNGATYGVALDASGRRVDPEQLLAREENARLARYGRIDAALARRLARASESDRIDVVIWLKEAASALPPTPFAEKVTSTRPTTRGAARTKTTRWLERLDETRREFVRRSVAPVVTRLRMMGYQAATSPHAPVLQVPLTASDIRVAATWLDVDTIYAASRVEPKMNIAVKTVGANRVYAYGLTGSGVRVAQVESGGLIAGDNPYLASVFQDTAETCLSNHSTGVAGIIRWIAPAATLLATGSCSGRYLLNRSSYAITWGAAVTNHSWGEARENCRLNQDDRYLDALVFNQARAQIVAAGNSGTGFGGNGCVDSPASGYNVVAVGNFNDRPNRASWRGDRMNRSSSFRDPISVRGDREMPHVAAPGTRITSTTTTNPWIGPIGSGTSFAAPIVTGETGLLIHRDPRLAAFPETTRAVIMASAIHNIQGAKRLSERDGAGGIWIPAADAVAAGVTGSGWTAYTYSCAARKVLNAAQPHIAAGKRVRVVTSWSTNPKYRYYRFRPSADLDLKIRRPGGRIVAKSLSYDNTYEIVDFTAPVAGRYTFKVLKHRCNRSPRRMGIAWWIKP